MFIDFVYAAETAEHIAEEAVEEGVLASLGVNASLFVFQLINFIIVSVIIWFLILKPLTKKMAERQKMIEESLNNAEKIHTNLQKSEKDYQDRIDTAKVEANKILEKTGVEAKKLSDSLNLKAKKEIEILVEQARKNIILEKEKMVVDLKKETVDLIVKALEKILTEKVDSEKDKKIIEEALKKINV